MTKRVEALLREIMENGLVFDVRTWALEHLEHLHQVVQP